MQIGLLFDFPQRDDGVGFEHAIRLGLAASGAPTDTITFLRETAVGLPMRTAQDTAAGFERLVAAGVDLIVGPSISDNCLAARDAADRAEVPAINYSGGERTRSEWMFHYQIGSLEDEPPLLVDRLRARGLTRAAVVHDVSVVGDRYREVFGWAAVDAAIVITATAAIDPLAEELEPVVASLRETGPDVVIYLGLGAAAHGVATAITNAGWDVPVLANSALMFGYVRPEWRDAWATWEYVDTLADDNPARTELAELDPRVAAGPMGCAAYDIGRLVGLASRRADSVEPAGLRDALERVKQIPAASGRAGTLMGFGVWDHAALKGPYLVLRAWRDGRTVQIQP